MENTRNSIKETFSVGSSSDKSSGGFGFDFKVEDKDNAQNGLVKKEQGNRDTKQVNVDVIMELTNVHGPEDDIKKENTIKSKIETVKIVNIRTYFKDNINIIST